MKSKGPESFGEHQQKEEIPELKELDEKARVELRKKIAELAPDRLKRD